MDQIVTFFNDFYQLFTVVIPSFISDAVIYMGKLVVYGLLQAKLAFLQLSFDIAGSILTDLNVNQVLQSAFDSLDSNAASIATYFMIPTVVQNIITAYATRFVVAMLS